MPTIESLVYDAIGSVNGVTLEQAHELLPAIPPSSVTAAAHRLSSSGALTLQRNGRAIIYCAKAGSRPEDKRGRPRRIAVAPCSETSG